MILEISWWNRLRLQDRASPLIEQLIYFYDHTIVIIVIILIFVIYIVVCTLINTFRVRSFTDRQTLEGVWTVLPAVVLLSVAFPSLHLLYLLDEVNTPDLTLKVVGHQWYWRYEYSDFLDVDFDSYIIPTSDLPVNGFRLLETDNHTVVPYITQVRVLVTAADVIHSWAVPSLGVKVDAVPGRLNQLSLICNRPGLYYGQCSEICGANHSFIPITIEAVSVDAFAKWVISSVLLGGWR